MWTSANRSDTVLNAVPQPTPTPAAGPSRDLIQVKVHIRRPEKDAWVYLGRGLVSHEVNGHSSRVGACEIMQISGSWSHQLMSFEQWFVLHLLGKL